MSTTSDIEKLYRQQLVKHYDKLSMSGLPERNPGLSEIPLEKVFVKLELKTQQLEMEDGFLYIEDDEGKLHSLEILSQFRKDKESHSELHQFRTRLWEAKNRQPQPVNLSVAEALHRHRHLVVLGGPGAGKTTLTRWLTVNFAKQQQGRADALGEQFRQHRLPILLELRRFADRFKQHSQQPTTPDLVEEIANFVHQDSRFGNPPVELIAKALADGRCLILLDGVDEIADDGAREALTRSIKAFFLDPDRDHRENLCLVTSRPHGYQDGALAAGFQRCEVAPFSNDDVKEFIEHWYATAYGDEEKEEASELIAAIAANANVSQLATNPLLCTIIAIVYRNNRVLPNRRVELYLKCCEALLDTWERTKNIRDSGLIGRYDWQTKLDLLAPVAYWLHSQVQRLSAHEDDFVEQLAQVLRNKGLVQNEIGAREEARRFITAIRDRSGLLQGRGDGTLEFMHRTFQEYLTARYIADQAYPDYIDLVMEHLHEAWWREVHLLVIGYLGSGSGGAEKVSSLLETILQYPAIPLRLLRPIPKLHLIANLHRRLLHRWQMNQRLGWALQREFALAVQGVLDCSPLGIRSHTTALLRERAQSLWIRALHDYSIDQALLGRLPTAATSSFALKQSAVDRSLGALDDSEGYVRRTAAAALGNCKIEDEALLSRVVVRLHRELYGFQTLRQTALQSLKKLLDGRRLPAEKWTPLRQRRERRRAFNRAMHWLILAAGVGLAAYGLAFLDQTDRVMKFIVVLGGIIGIAAGVAQISGKTLRNPWE